MLNTEHWQTYALNLSNNAIRHVFTLFFLIPSTFWFKSPLKSFAKIALLALPLLSYSWQLQAANGSNNQVKRSDAIIFLSKKATITYVRPNLGYNGYGMGSGNNDMGGIAGPINIWDYEKGFLVQSINPELYDLNFPTTGMDGLYFDLRIEGVDADELTWEPVTHEGITATVTRKEANDYWIPKDNHLPPPSYWGPNYPDGTEVVTRVTLTGPQARSQWNNDHPGGIQVPKLPQTFELVGKDRDGYEVVRYGFVLKQWFVIRNPPGTSRGEEIKESEGDKSPSSNDTDYKENPERYTYSNAKAWCESLGYRLPHIKDLTNAKCSYTISGSRLCRGAVSATPISDDQFHYQRRIGSGMTGEWGELSRYRINPSNLGRYRLLSAWTGDSRLDYPNEHPFAVDLNNGMISPDRTSEANKWSSYCHRLNNGTVVDSSCLGQALCVTP